MQKLFVDSFIKDQAPNLGQSRPLLVQASDGDLYFIKNNFVRTNEGWINENAVFFHEVLAHNMAKYLGIDVPDITILEIENDIMTANSDLLFQKRYSPGLYFGTKKVNEVEDNLFENFSELVRLKKPYIRRPWNQFFKDIQNPEIVSSIIVMDLLLGNFDRFDNKGNLIIGKSEKGRMLYAIDHGHCFGGPVYDKAKESFLRSNIFNDSAEMNNYINSQLNLIINIAQYYGGRRPFNLAGEVFKAIETHVHLENPDNHSFMEPIYLLETLDKRKLDDMLSDIPEEWLQNKLLQKDLYSEFIIRQAKLVRPMIERLTLWQAFSNYRGGALKWKSEIPTGTL
ncbi:MULTISPECIES: HipA family kinase [Enterococcus]|uniref:HipA family kinase n=1 Tax=Enterococcus TaxID=1350 RepID=UPI001865D4B1|nr:HipA family kinase [Enterococcus faecium]EGP4909418.1 hypothetical protein [Enterococcus faecium]MBE2902070.1 hypothetical protein [Enterococcus faecium]MCU2160927.1 phosphatidylinositol 4-kinase [Enterococcus faecium]QVW90480.1 hypothetical protein I8F52_04575 [Enterococcus faecium]QVW90531.1 hypothetical protein I8F52_04840 [Enterococcus faecium]